MGVIVAALVAVFWRVIFTTDMFFYRDVYNFSYPHAKFIHDMLRQGRLPYWDPYLDYGEPVLADPNFLFFYPSTLLLGLLPASLAYTWHYLLHFLIAALGAYWLARRFSQSRPAALFAALTFGLSGPVLSLGNFYNEVACAVWVPWALLLTDRVLKRRNRRSWILLTAVFALEFLAAEPFTLMASFALCFAYAMWQSLRDNPAAHSEGYAWTQPVRTEIRALASRVDWRLVGGFTLAGALALALSAASLLPSLDLLAHSQRGVTGMPYRETTHWSFHPLYLLEFVLPDFFGSVLSGETLWSIVLSTRNNPYFPSFFVGFVPLLFALAGWVLGRDPRRRFVAWSGLVFLLLSFGALTPVFALVYLVFPPLSLVRFPVKLLILVVLAIALLAGWGVDALAGVCRGDVRDLDGPGRQGNLILWPLRAMLAASVVIWIASLVLPKMVSAAGTSILVHTNNMFLRDESGRLKTEELGQAAQYLVSRIRLEFPVLMTLALGTLIWMRLLFGQRAPARLLGGSLALISSLGLVQVILVNRDANPTVPRLFYDYTPPVLSQVPASPGPYRFCNILHGEVTTAPGPTDTGAFLNFDQIPGANRFSALAQIAFRDRLVLKHGSLLASAETSLNNDVDLSFPPDLYDFWYFAIRQMRNQTRSDCLIGRANVKYLIRPEPEPSSATRLIGHVFNGSPKPAFLYEDLCFLPRAFVAASAVTSRNSLDTLVRLSDPRFDPHAQVILAEKPGTEPSALSPPETPPTPSVASRTDNRIGEIKTLDDQPNSVSLTVSLSEPGYLVLLDRFDPNWHATVDGREVMVLRADQLFRAVKVSAGSHQVRFYYRQKGLVAGTVISCMMLLTLLVAWWVKQSLL